MAVPPVDDSPAPSYLPPYFPPPMPPDAPPWAYEPWTPTPPPPTRRGSRLAIVGLIIVALVFGAIGVAIGSALGSRSNGQTGVALPTPGTGSAPSQSSVAAPQGVAAKVDPSVVDVTTHLSGSATAEGTGMVLTASGVVLTNNHVIDGAISISAQVNGTGTTYSATVVGYDRTDDIAVIQLVNASGLTPITPGNSSKLSVGESVVAIGNALGKGGAPAAATGRIIALDQTITATDAGGGNSETLNGLIEMNAAIQPGDSGGPLADSAGSVIGMNTAGSFSGTRRRGGGATGDGFAIPINNALTVAQKIESGQGSSTIQVGQRGIMGVAVRDGSSPSGALVDAVDPGSPAATAGLVAGDVVVSIDGKSVDSTNALSAALTGKHAGDTVEVGWVDQSGQNHTAKVQLIAGPPN